MKARPRILLVEDDATSRAFLDAALRRVPADVEAAADAASASALAASGRFDAWLIDAHLPDASGVALLARLRMAGGDAIALAHTASGDPALHARLRAAGFAAVLVKPLAADALVATVREALGVPAGDRMLPLWDDEAALRALNGQPAHALALRGLFVAELPELAARIAAAVRDGDAATARDALHRLTASCGFVGAARLGDATRALHRAPDSAHLHAFDAAVRGTLAQAQDALSPSG